MATLVGWVAGELVVELELPHAVSASPATIASAAVLMMCLRI